MHPRTRIDHVEIQETPGELLVYDLERQKAHCLNRTAALVWQRCDGRSSAGQIADALRAELHPTADEALVALTLRDLDRARLLQPADGVDATERPISRRRMLQSAGVAMLLPLVVTVGAPTAAQAASGQRSSRGGRGLGRGKNGNRGKGKGANNGKGKGRNK